MKRTLLLVVLCLLLSPTLARTAITGCLKHTSVAAVPVPTCRHNITGTSRDLDTQLCDNAAPPPAPLAAVDTTYVRRDLSNTPVSGHFVPDADGTRHNGITAARWNGYFATPTAKSLNGVRFADQWCTTPGTLDQSCIQNAINDISANGTLMLKGGRAGHIYVPPGEYAISSSVTVPLGTVIDLGGSRADEWGAHLVSATGVDLLAVNANTISIHNLAFKGAGLASSLITLGVTGGQQVGVATIYDNVFDAARTAAIKCLNCDGASIYGNNFTASANFGFYCSVSNTNACSSNRITDNIFYGNLAAAIQMNGNNVGDAGLCRDNIITGNTFSTNGSAGSPVGIAIYNQCSEMTITGNQFNKQYGDDIYLSAAKNITISGNSTNRTGKGFINSVGSSGIVVDGNIGSSSNYARNGETTAFISFSAATCANNSITNNTLNAWSGQALATYGLLVTVDCTATTIAGNNLTGATAAYSIADTTAAFVTKGLVSADRVTIGGGSALATSNQKGTGSIVMSSSPTIATPTFSGNTIESTANGATWTHGSISEEITLSTRGSTTDSTADLLPANSIIEAVVARVTTTITTATDWELGDGTVAGRFAAPNSTLTAGTTEVGLAHVDLTGTSGPRQTAAAKLRVTCTGTPGAGKIRVTVFYRSFVSPQS